MSSLPTGTVTLLFTDIEGSTRLLYRLGDDYAALLEEHRKILRHATSEHGGQEVDAPGDGMFFAFGRARDAVMAAVEAQRAILSRQWPGGVELKVRIGLHTGEPARSQIGYVGPDVHRAARICSAAHGGQIVLSEGVQGLVEHNLPPGISLRDLGSHRLKDLAKPIQLFQVLASGLAADFPPVRSLNVRRHNLPLQLTSFVGREREIREVNALLGGARLLTLTGAGGVGKTRMALQVAAYVLDEFPDGVWVVELGRISNPALIPHSVASAVGALEEQGGRPLTETLIDFLRSLNVLVILDNCEHLLTDCANLALALLQACRSLRIVATSLQPLGVPGELTYRVSSLALPEGSESYSEAVRLFIDRASSSRPGFELRNGSLAAVVDICRHLDGIPLALELAAARVKVLAPEQIAERLVDRFRLLSGGTRTDLPQHQTLRAVMDWSYQLLAVEEQVLLRRLAAFVGSFPLEAAESACAGDGVGEKDVFELLTRLVDKSLVVTEEHPRTVRYRLLETVREYGREKLRDAGEFATIHTRHRDWYLALAERAAPEILSGPHQREWLGRVELEHDNLRAALEWSHAASDGAEPMLRLAGALWWYWFTRGNWTEAREWLTRGLSRQEGASAQVRSRALVGLAIILWVHGEPQRTTALAEESLALSEAGEDTWGTATALLALGIVASEGGAMPRAVQVLERSLTLFQTLHHPVGIAISQLYLGYAVAGHDYGRAVQLFENSQALLRRVGDRRSLAVVVGTLGDAAWLQGNYHRAVELYEECGALGRELGYRERIAYSLLGLGGVASARGEYDKAIALAEQSLETYRQIRWQMGIGLCLRRLGTTAVNHKDFTKARAWFQEALEIFRALEQPSHIGDVLDALGVVSWGTGDPDGAATFYAQALELFRQVNDGLGIAEVLVHQGKIAQRQGDAAAALAKYRSALTIRWDFGFKLGIAECLEALASLTLRGDEPSPGAHLLGAAAAIRESLNAPIPPLDRDEVEQAERTARKRLGGRFSELYDEGRKLTLEQAVSAGLGNHD